MLVSAQMLATEVKKMRDQQKEYFKRRDPVVLFNCKAQEKKVDELTTHVLTKQQVHQGNLFDKS